MKYLGIDPQRVKVGVFDFTCCEGCELQLANKEESLLDFLSLLEVVNFREVSSRRGQDYDIALVEGSISRYSPVPVCLWGTSHGQTALHLDPPRQISESILEIPFLS